MGSANSITNYTVGVHGISLVPAGTLISLLPLILLGTLTLFCFCTTY